MTPTNFYYLGLYLLVFVIRFFKVYKDYSNQKANGKEKFNWRPVFFVSLEIVYTSAGFVIMLLENSRDWIATIVIFYIIFVLISANIDSLGEKFSERTKLYVHLILIIFIVSITTYSFSTILKPRPQTTINVDNKVNSYKVALPYIDNSLVQHLGFKIFNNKRLQITYSIEALNIKEAIEKAKEKFWNDSTLMPFSSSKVNLKRDLLVIDENKMVVQKIE